MIRCLLLCFMGAVLFSACGIKPQPIAFGSDECVFCKMIIMDKRFACQIVNTKGKAFKYDDLSCGVSSLKTGLIKEADIGEIYIADYLPDHELKPVGQLHFVSSETLRSPMGGNKAAFTHTDSADYYVKQLSGQLKSWAEIMNDE